MHRIPTLPWNVNKIHSVVRYNKYGQNNQQTDGVSPVVVLIQYGSWKIHKGLLETLFGLNSRLFSEYNSIKTYDFSTLYPHIQLKSWRKNIIHFCYSKRKTGTPRYKYVVLGWDSSYFVKNNSKYTEEDIFKMLDFFNNIFVPCGACVLQQKFSIPMRTNCASLLPDLFLQFYEADFIADLIQRKEHCLARSFDVSFCYIDDVLSFNNPSFGDLRHCIYPKNLR